MKIVFLIGNNYLFFKLPQIFLKEQNLFDIKVIIEDTTSILRIFSVLLKRIKKYGFIKVVDEIFFKIFEIFFLKKNLPKINSNEFNVLKKTIDLNSLEIEQILVNENPDFIIVCGTQILKENIFNKAKIACINIHPGILPLYRGYGNFWALYNADFKNIGFTFHHIDKGIDTGSIIYEKNIEYKKEFCNINILNENIFSIAAIKLNEIIQEYINNNSFSNSYNKQNIFRSQYYTIPGITDYLKMKKILQ